MRTSTTLVSGGTMRDLIKAAGLGTRMAVRARRLGGQDDETIRRDLIERFRKELSTESFGPFEDETLMATVQRTIESMLAESRHAWD